MIGRKKIKHAEHHLAIITNLWESILLRCECGWEYKNPSPWAMREIVDICNMHIREQKQKEAADE